MPNTEPRFLGKDEILSRVPVSDTTLWRMCKDGGFPKPIAISGNRKGWLSADVDAWFAARTAESQAA